MNWTAKACERLEVLIIRGKLSAGNTAAILNREFGDCTRNAVIGKCLRAGLRFAQKRVEKLARPPRPPRLPRPSRPKPEPKARIIKKPFILKPMNIWTKPAAPAAHVATITADFVRGPGVQIMELTERTCRWPIGDPLREDFRYCGADKQPDGKPYCSHCRAITYTPRTVNRRTGAEPFHAR